jgi:predicted enzyme related to lactoylglutathione lyase
MGTRANYTPGTFSWTDLTTTDQEAAKSFYGELFGWESVDFPVGNGVVFSMMRLGGADVAAISPQPQQQRDAGVPPAWNSYITVQSADEALARAHQLGADVHADAFDVMAEGGIRPVMGPEPPYWAVYFGTDDLEASTRRVAELGGEELTGSIELGPGRVTYVRDAQGAVFILYSGRFDD